jgi:hypothetical protein
MIAIRVIDKLLHEKTIRLGHTVVEGGSVYPFFRETGEVVYLMVVLPNTSRVFMLPYTKGMIYVHLWGVVRMEVTPDQLKALGDLQAKQLDGLFHYDSKWVLKEERFKNYWARDIIQQTNCAETLREQIGKEINKLRFSKDLSKLVSVGLRPRSPNVSSTLSADEVLASLAESGSKKSGAWAENGNQQWELDPVWENWMALDTIGLRDKTKR